MQLLAQFSPNMPTIQRRFWADLEQTEEWLQNLNKDVTERTLFLRGKTLAQLEPWLPWLRSPVEMEGWLDPMEVQLTWRYLLEFLVDSGPDSIMIPCGGEAAVQWSSDKITVRAPHHSWLWSHVIDSWDPAAWPVEERVEWWEHGRLQQAARTHWGLFEQWQYPYGMEEWRIHVNHNFRAALRVWWQQLAKRLGSRTLKVSWRKESPDNPDRLLGLPVRTAFVGIQISGNEPEFWPAVLRWPEPRHLRAVMHWFSPAWNAWWATRVSLKRWKQGTRLEAQYTLSKRPLTKNAVRIIRQEMHHFPIFHLQPVMMADTVHIHHGWSALVERAEASQWKEQVTNHLNTYSWPRPQSKRIPRRIRLSSSWTVDRLSSHRGMWTIKHQTLPLTLQIYWPRRNHAGNLTVTFQNQVTASLYDLDPRSEIDRFSLNRRYWAAIVVYRILPMLEQLVLNPERS